MRLLKIKKFVKTLLLTCTLMLAGAVFTASAQNDRMIKSGNITDNMKDQHMDYVQQINRIIEAYPAFSYHYTMENGKVKDVVINGIDNDIDRERLEVVLFNLNSKRNRIEEDTDANRVGVFYDFDKPARYEDGQEALTKELQSHLEYPEGAENWGVEGTIYVKVIVDDKGNIPFATTTTDIDASVTSYVDDLRAQAVEAVEETSGDWEPATVNGVDVASLAVIPVTFELDESLFPH